MPPATRRLLVLIVAVAAALRLFAIWFGLPHPQARPDEETAIGKALDVLGGERNPRFFHWPSLTLYVFAGIVWIGQSVHDLVSRARALTFSERALLTRAVVALAGTSTILVLFSLARRMAGDRIALLASALLAVAILHVRESHFATTDALATLLVLAALAYLMKAVVPAGPTLRPDRADIAGPTSSTRPDVSTLDAPLTTFAMAGVVAGLATSTRYSAAAVVLSMLAVQTLLVLAAPHARRSARAWLPSIAFVAAMFAGFVIATPYALLDRETFARDFLFDLEHLSEPHRGILLGRGWTYHLTHSLPYGVGVVTWIAAVTGVVPFVRHYRRAAFVLGAFALPFYLAIGSGYTVFFRYVLPLAPLVCLSAAIGITHTALALARGLAGVRSGFMRAPAGALTTTALAAIALGPSLIQSVRFDRVLARTDTRVLAGAWLESRIRPEDTLYDAGSSYTRLNIWRVPFRRLEYDEATGAFAESGPSVSDSGPVRPDWLVLHESPLSTYAAVPPALQTLANSSYVLVHEEPGTRSPCDVRARTMETACGETGAIYDLQDAFFVPFSSFASVVRPGPDISIYRRQDPRAGAIK